MGGLTPVFFGLPFALCPSRCIHRKKESPLKEKDPPGSHDKAIRWILEYWIEHPDAKDTPDGIYKWWLPEGQGAWGREEVKKVLDFLTSKGWLTKRETSPSKEIYGINKDQLEEIKNFLNHF